MQGDAMTHDDWTQTQTGNLEERMRKVMTDEITNEEWLTDHGFENHGYNTWVRDNVRITLGKGGASCRIYGDWDVTAVSATGDTAELVMYHAVAALQEAHRRVLAIWEGA